MSPDSDLRLVACIVHHQIQVAEAVPALAVEVAELQDRRIARRQASGGPQALRGHYADKLDATGSRCGIEQRVQVLFVEAK